MGNTMLGQLFFLDQWRMWGYVVSITPIRLYFLDFSLDYILSNQQEFVNEQKNKEKE